MHSLPQRIHSINGIDWSNPAMQLQLRRFFKATHLRMARGEPTAYGRPGKRVPITWRSIRDKDFAVFAHWYNRKSGTSA